MVPNANPLLQLGHDQAEALEPTFELLHKLALSLASLLKRSRFFYVNSEIRESLGHGLYVDLLTLVTDVALYYRKSINSSYYSLRDHCTVR